MKMQFETEIDFNVFINELRERLEAREIRGVDNDGLKHASVMMLLMNKENSPHVLLTKRTEKVSTHKGQVSFPGGAKDEEDRDFLETAYRETFEEVGIPPGKIDYIGRFDDFVSISGFHVSCFVGVIKYPYEHKINRDEIEVHLDAPLAIFVNQEYERADYYEFNDRKYRVFYYLHDGFNIWGLTARILTDFGRKICS